MNKELAAEHRERHAQFRELIEKIESVDQPWSCVVRFYAALHLLTAYLVIKKNVRFSPGTDGHRERRLAMQKCPELKYANRSYSLIKELSESVRYDPGYKYTPQNHTASKASLDTLTSVVAPLVDNLLG
jgi:hypothetical protein